MEKATVRSKLKGTAVALWEKHPDHPNGEVFVAGPEPVEVAMTPMVHKRISNGMLEVVTEKAKTATKDKGKPKSDALPSPWDGYDNANVDEILEKLKDSDKPARDKVLAYERANKKRDGVITPLANWAS